MAVGNKKFFRHHNQARRDSKIVQLIIEYGKDAYFHFFALVEMCSEKSTECSVLPEKFSFHRRVVATELYTQNAKLKAHLNALKAVGLIDFEFEENNVNVSIPNLYKYLGKYIPKYKVAEEESSDTEVVAGPSEGEVHEETLVESEVHKGNLGESEAIEVVPVNDTPIKKQSKGRSPEEKEKARSIKLAYKKSYYERYKIEPTFAAKENAMVYMLINNVGYEEAFRLSRAYPFYNDKWHVNQKHPFRLLVGQLDKVRVELANPDRMLDDRIVDKQLAKASEEIEGHQEKEMRRRKMEQERRQIAEQRQERIAS